jgi:hypothetical protein
MEAYRKKIQDEAKVEPSKKVQELESVISNLKANASAYEREKAELVGQFKREPIKSSIIMGLEKEYLLSRGDMLNLMISNGYEFDEDSGKTIVKLNGNILRDEKTQDPLPVSSVFESFATSKNLLKTETTPPPANGRGAGSTKKPVSSFNTLAEFQKHWESEGKSVNSSDFAAAALKYREESGNPNFMNQ